MVHIVILSLVILGVVFHGEALQCYECQNCELVPQNLTTCGGEETTTTGPTDDGVNTGPAVTGTAGTSSEAGNTGTAGTSSEAGNTGTAGTSSEAGNTGTETTTTEGGEGVFEESVIGSIEYFKDYKADPYAETYVCVAYSEEVILNGDQNNVTTTSIRSCLKSSQLINFCPTSWDDTRNSFRVHVCTTDGCNGASRTSALVAGTPLILSFVVLTQFVVALK